MKKLLSAALVSLATIIPVALLTTLVMFVADTEPAAGDDRKCSIPTVGDVPQLDEQQTGHAVTIIEKGVEVGVSERGLVVAIATAYQESKLRNLANPTYPETLDDPRAEGTGHDHDSVGLFQQRHASGWGTPDQLLDPEYAAAAFFGGPDGPNEGSPRGLLDIDGWQSTPIWQAAQSVQISAFPHAYAQWENLAYATVETITGAGVTCDPGTAAGECPPSGLAVEEGLTPDAQLVVRCIHERYPHLSMGGIGDRPNKSDHPSGRAVDVMIPAWDTPDGRALGNEIANLARSNASQWGVTYVIWADEIWSRDRGRRAYTHPSGNTTSATLRHLDHVHISVHGTSTNGRTVTAGGTGEWTKPLSSGSYSLTSPFGMRTHPITGVYKLHTGQDFGTSGRTPPVFAVGDGEVISASGPGGPYGNLVKIDHGGGVVTWYAHLSVIHVRSGHVEAGDQIGNVGTTGYSTAEHLHLEVRRNGTPIDPVSWLRSKGVQL